MINISNIINSNQELTQSAGLNYLGKAIWWHVIMFPWFPKKFWVNLMFDGVSGLTYLVWRSNVPGMFSVYTSAPMSWSENVNITRNSNQKAFIITIQTVNRHRRRAKHQLLRSSALNASYPGLPGLLAKLLYRHFKLPRISEYHIHALKKQCWYNLEIEICEQK